MEHKGFPAEYHFGENKQNQGIVEGRREAKVVMDTASDPDASAAPSETVQSNQMAGATSQDVHEGLGHPGSGMSSKELRHDGQPGRHRRGQGVSQFGPPKTRDVDWIERKERRSRSE
ncbi:hypothetical protein AX17_003711 [Amanita inopinata Kibby_2008]|nr:hypothetical protein AX17_003711 [Amanita inopinata Kibby_2008]